MNEACKTCRFWDGYRESSWDQDGKCRKRAPVAVEDARSRGEVKATWPTTYDKQWCGEWQVFVVTSEPA